MKGVQTVVKALVAVALAIAIVMLITVGSKAILNLMEGNMGEIILIVDDTLVSDAMVDFCELECKECCMLAEGTIDERTETCDAVVKNAIYDRGNETAYCGEYMLCKCR